MDFVMMRTHPGIAIRPPETYVWTEADTARFGALFEKLHQRRVAHGKLVSAAEWWAVREAAKR